MFVERCIWYSYGTFITNIFGSLEEENSLDQNTNFFELYIYCILCFCHVLMKAFKWIYYLIEQS